ncbi:hypothetical protein SAMN05421736_1369 [Evansella caseinilytica]|uniref:Uncharacterized protein n=1 Tax=Evansella caseinilytica TaxID=1503961 RepID=A0A1H3V1X1_9BACI|nr:hypothetical protein SAMN05421736_1369 [Evansella caseinilytica]
MFSRIPVNHCTFASISNMPSVIGFGSHVPNFLESEAQEVAPSPQIPVILFRKMAFTISAIALRRLSLSMYFRRIYNKFIYFYPCSPFEIRFSPAFVPKPYKRLFCSISVLMPSLEAAFLKSTVFWTPFCILKPIFLA